MILSIIIVIRFVNLFVTNMMMFYSFVDNDSISMKFNVIV